MDEEVLLKKIFYQIS